MADGEVPRGGGPSRDELTVSAPSQVKPESLRGFRAQLTKGKDAVDLNRPGVSGDLGG
ncbi:MAG: hypothetical protein H0U15_12060 [Geodermatophilaceae bacterium]|nr:hypothetical protein [Geodermatophilaceae bacterium]